MTKRDEERLARALTDSEGEADPALRDLFERRPELREEFGELRDLSHALEQHGAAERAAVERARAHVRPGDRAALAAAFAARAVHAPAHARRRPLVPWALAAALALVLGAWLALRAGEKKTTRPPVVLGVASLAEAAPSGPGADFSQFRWRWAGELPPATGFLLRVERAGADGATPEPPIEIRCEEPRWKPSAEERAKLGREIRWQVVALLPGGDERSSGWVSASSR